MKTINRLRKDPNYKSFLILNILRIHYTIARFIPMSISSIYEVFKIISKHSKLEKMILNTCKNGSIEEIEHLFFEVSEKIDTLVADHSEVVKKSGTYSVNMVDATIVLSLSSYFLQSHQGIVDQGLIDRNQRIYSACEDILVKEFGIKNSEKSH